MTRKMELSDAEKRRRSELARNLNKKKDPVTGRPLFGGAQPGAGRPRKKRATEIINERIEDHADEIFQRLLKSLRSNKDYAALGAAKLMVEIANKETDIQRQEERSLEETPTDELIELVTSRFARLAEGGFIDVESVELGEPPGLDAGSGVEDDAVGLAEDSEASSGLGASPFTRRTTN